MSLKDSKSETSRTIVNHCEVLANPKYIFYKLSSFF